MQCEVFNITYNGAVNFDLKNQFVVITITFSVHVFFQDTLSCSVARSDSFGLSPFSLYIESKSFNSLKYFAVGFICSCAGAY